MQSTKGGFRYRNTVACYEYFLARSLVSANQYVLTEQTHAFQNINDWIGRNFSCVGHPIFSIHSFSERVS